MRQFRVSHLLIMGMLFATPSFASEDKTSEFRDFFTNQFLGEHSQTSKTWDHKTCSVTNPFSGNCIEHIGFVINGEASGTVDQLVSSGGHGVLLESDLDPWTGITKPWLRMQQDFVFHYSGESFASKNCFPGNFRCDNPWNSLHPTGNIKIAIAGSRDSGFTVRVVYEVNSGHEDRVNNLLRQAMVKLSDKVKSIIEDYQEANRCRPGVNLDVEN